MKIIRIRQKILETLHQPRVESLLRDFIVTDIKNLQKSLANFKANFHFNGCPLKASSASASGHMKRNAVASKLNEIVADAVDGKIVSGLT